MTHLQMQQQLDLLYRYQQPPQAAQGPGPARSRGPPPHPDSSHPPRNSRSSIGPVGVPLRQQGGQNPHLQAQAVHYSLELHRQQQEQLRQRLQHQREREELLRWEESRGKLRRTSSMETVRGEPDSKFDVPEAL